MAINRIIRIAIGLALIGYGVYSGNAWFYLGIMPLITGIINWCPLEMKMGTCDPASGCCSSPKSNDESIPYKSNGIPLLSTITSAKEGISNAPLTLS